jgi:hypothetical protein
VIRRLQATKAFALAGLKVKLSPANHLSAASLAESIGGKHRGKKFKPSFF